MSFVILASFGLALSQMPASIDSSVSCRVAGLVAALGEHHCDCPPGRRSFGPVSSDGRLLSTGAVSGIGFGVVISTGACELLLRPVICVISMALCRDLPSPKSAVWLWPSPSLLVAGLQLSAAPPQRHINGRGRSCRSSGLSCLRRLRLLYSCDGSAYSILATAPPTLFLRRLRLLYSCDGSAYRGHAVSLRRLRLPRPCGRISACGTTGLRAHNSTCGITRSNATRRPFAAHAEAQRPKGAVRAVSQKRRPRLLYSCDGSANRGRRRAAAQRSSSSFTLAASCGSVNGLARNANDWLSSSPFEKAPSG